MWATFYKGGGLHRTLLYARRPQNFCERHRGTFIPGESDTFHNLSTGRRKGPRVKFPEFQTGGSGTLGYLGETGRSPFSNWFSTSIILGANYYPGVTKQTRGKSALRHLFGGYWRNKNSHRGPQKRGASTQEDGLFPPKEGTFRKFSIAGALFPKSSSFGKGVFTPR